MNDLEIDDFLNIVLKGIISGFLIAYLIILGLRPSAEYPDNILEIIDNPWIFIVLILVNFYAIQWDMTIGLLLLLSIIALLLDVIIFTEGEVFNNDINIENFKNDSESDSDSDSESDSSDDEETKETKETKENNSKDKKQKPNNAKKKLEKSNKDENKLIEKIVSKVLKSIKNNLDEVLN